MGIDRYSFNPNEANPMPRYDCPNCKAILQPPKAIAPGKKVRCPECQTVFVPVPLLSDDSEELKVANPVATARPKPAPIPEAKPTAKSKPQPTPEAKPAKKTKPPTADPDDDDTPYSIAAVAPETEEQKKNKPKFGEVKERWKKSMRPAALAMVTGPGNRLLMIGLFQAIFFTAMILRHVLPLATPISEGYKDDDDKSPAQVQTEKDKNKQQKKEPVGYTKSEHFMWIGIYILGLVYSSVIAVGASKMQNLDSITWGYVAAIMQMVAAIPILILYVFNTLAWVEEWYWAIVPGLIGLLQGLLPGIACLTILNHPDVKAGFQEPKPDA